MSNYNLPPSFNTKWRTLDGNQTKHLIGKWQELAHYYGEIQTNSLTLCDIFQQHGQICSRNQSDMSVVIKEIDCLV